MPRGQYASRAIWTVERVAQLRKLWAEGLSATLIAKELGVDRGSIAGKIHRLKLPKRKSTACHYWWAKQPQPPRALPVAPVRIPMRRIGPPKEAPQRVFSSDPASLAAAALFASADAAQRRCDSMRGRSA